MKAKLVGADVALGGADLFALVALRPHLRSLAATLRHPHAAVARQGADAALASVAGAAVWVVAAWLAVGLLATSAVRIPGAGGRAAAWLSRVLLPSALRAALAGSAGLSLLITPAAALAHGTAAPPGATATSGTGAPPRPATTVPSPAWPVDPSTTPPPVWPTTPATASPARPPAPRPPAPRPHEPRPAAPPASDPKPPAGPDAGPSRAAVTVRPGDSLWSIAARRLGADATPRRIATEWPRWWRANRVVVGDDPSLIRPGQVLQPPPDRTHDNQEARR